MKVDAEWEIVNEKEKNWIIFALAYVENLLNESRLRSS